MSTNSGGPYPESWPAAGRPNTRLTVSNLSLGNYYFIVAAVNASNVARDFSNQSSE
jgi:hypothetical protein